jgi:hypothetical protein
MAPHDHHPLPWLRCPDRRAQRPQDPTEGDQAVSRHNRKAPNRRRISQRPQSEPIEIGKSFEALANELVRRGLASPAVLSGAIYYPRTGG